MTTMPEEPADLGRGPAGGGGPPGPGPGPAGGGGPGPITIRTGPSGASASTVPGLAALRRAGAGTGTRGGRPVGPSGRSMGSSRRSMGSSRRGGLPGGVRLRRALALVVVVALLAAVFVGAQLARGVPRPVVRVALARAVVVPGPPPVLPWPRGGEAAVAVAGLGTFPSPTGEGPIPIGSVAKIMTALVILRDHPLAPASDGPGITVTAADVAAYQADAANADSVAAVSEGEVLTERQALEALLVPSADNVALLLANWDAGSQAAFVAKMNATAASLRMTATHYVDASGLGPATVSSAQDQLRLAPLAMAQPALAATVRMPQVTLPVAGTVYNYNYLLGHDGVIGIKTGSTAQAKGCLVFAAQGLVAGRPRTIYGVVLGQDGTSPLAAALSAARKLLDGARAAVRPVTVLPAGTVAARVVAPWAPGAAASTAAPVSMLGWPGLRATLTTSTIGSLPSSGPLPAGSRVGQVSVQLGAQQQVVSLRTAQPVPGPGLGWRLGRT